ncbi:hypothetical protein [Archangium sp.]|uniref:hypothetical protein n=1 Tax=Archangium sp. TaxID=1872627 RepID=UPI002D480B38|nr:hypothetical protein [Archangium sp.]HYO56138.1 hypothetical protein [Archangium sp.]
MPVPVVYRTGVCEVECISPVKAELMPAALHGAWSIEEMKQPGSHGRGGPPDQRESQ